MLLFLKKENKKKVVEWKDKIQKIKKENKINKQQNKQKQQQHIIACAYMTGEDAIWQLFWMINR